MNKKILVSLSVIGAVAAIAVGGTIAYFSDTETSTGNTFTAGTIDIAIDTENPWVRNYSIGDLKPGETGYITFDITNVGANPVNISKTLTNIAGTGGSATFPCAEQSGTLVSSEPECSAEGATANDNVATQIVYDLSVKVYRNAGTSDLIWWQEIYDATQNQSLTDVYGSSGGNYVDLGMIPSGGHMIVTQSYHFNSSAGNEYQGDTLSFNMTIQGDQLPQADGYNTVVMENKGGAPDWQILNQDSIQGTLAYKTTGPNFSYTFSATVNTPGIGYTLLYVGPSGDFPYSGEVVLGTGTASGNSISLSGDVVTGTITNGKIWLVPSTTYPSGWDNANNLYETALINYTQN